MFLEVPLNLLYSVDSQELQVNLLKIAARRRVHCLAVVHHLLLEEQATCLVELNQLKHQQEAVFLVVRNLLIHQLRQVEEAYSEMPSQMILQRQVPACLEEPSQLKLPQGAAVYSVVPNQQINQTQQKPKKLQPQQNHLKTKQSKPLNQNWAKTKSKPKKKPKNGKKTSERNLSTSSRKSGTTSSCATNTSSSRVPPNFSSTS